MKYVEPTRLEIQTRGLELVVFGPGAELVGTQVRGGSGAAQVLVRVDLGQPAGRIRRPGVDHGRSRLQAIVPATDVQGVDVQGHPLSPSEIASQYAAAAAAANRTGTHR